jgi:hypothetical protein
MRLQQKFGHLIDEIRMIKDPDQRRPFAQCVIDELQQLGEHQCSLLLRWYGLFKHEKQSAQQLAQVYAYSSAESVRTTVEHTLRLLHESPNICALYPQFGLPEYDPPLPGPDNSLPRGLRWIDIPPIFRMTAQDFRNSGGAADRDWLAHRLRLLRNANAHRLGVCEIAVPWNRRKRYAPCGMITAEDETLCAIHGGPSAIAARRAKAAEADARAAALREQKRAEHSEWQPQGIVLAHQLQQRMIDRLHEQALVEWRDD